MLYTSGTTGQPKGVMHTANTQFANLRAIAPAIGLVRSDILLMGSPLAHQTGFLYGIMMPLYLGIKTVYQDVWDARTAAQRDNVISTVMSLPGRR